MDMLIDGGWTDASDGAVDPVLNPATYDHTAVRVETLPFGGNKGSGNGREGIHDTLHEMSKEKTLLLHEVFGAAV